jgi:integrase/recombinase XerD
MGQLTRELLWEWGADLREYISPRTGKPWSSAMIRQGIAAARAFLKWCEEQKIVCGLANVLKLPKQKKRIQRTVAADEILKLVESCPNTPKGQRDAALISMMVDSGLRATEVCRVRVKDIHFNVNKMGLVKLNFFIVTVKGGDEEIGYFGEATANRLKVWFETRQRLANEEVEAVFISLGGIRPRTGLTREGLKVIFRKLALNVEDVDHFSPHALRRSFACIAKYAGADFMDIKEWGRWNDLDMVILYAQAYSAGLKYKQFSPMDFIEKMKLSQETSQ